MRADRLPPHRNQPGFGDESQSKERFSRGLGALETRFWQPPESRQCLARIRLFRLSERRRDQAFPSGPYGRSPSRIVRLGRVSSRFVAALFTVRPTPRVSHFVHSWATAIDIPERWLKWLTFTYCDSGKLRVFDYRIWRKTSSRGSLPHRPDPDERCYNPHGRSAVVENVVQRGCTGSAIEIPVVDADLALRS